MFKILSTISLNRKILLTSILVFPVFWGNVSTNPVYGQDVDIKVGIIQRFGDEESDILKLNSLQGDTLTLQFTDHKGRPQQLQTSAVTIEIEQTAYPTPILDERVVLSDHATFETAEDSANQWKERGIAVEVTQPGRWQVWAKRDVYKTPLLRRLLLRSLKEKGVTIPYLDSELVSYKNQATLTIGDTRYTTEVLEIRSGKSRINVQEDENKARIFGGNLRLQPNSYRTYTLVNNVPLETYLRGVVPHEIGASAPDNAAKAQTIIARTYALRNLRRFQADNYELCANTHCQVYYGLSDVSPRADKMIAATRGLVLTYNNELVDALYSSTTGGVTARFSDVWNGEERPYLTAIIDSPQSNLWDLGQQSLADEQAFRQFIALNQGFNETGRRVFRWRRKSSLEELNEDLQTYLERKKHPLADFTTIKGMKVTERSPSGRVLALTVWTDKGELVLRKNEARSAFGPPRSTLFYLEPILTPNQELSGYIFVGGGFGHGVGLSQFGSYNLANLGWSAERILSFYYPGTQIQPLNESIVFWTE
ncbi:MAG: SpoIID/LytB domain-containing protein [Microcystaceae cyanobacterium]